MTMLKSSWALGSLPTVGAGEAPGLAPDSASGKDSVALRSLETDLRSPWTHQTLVLAAMSLWEGGL